MFLAHIAFSLELITLAVGVFMVFIAHRYKYSGVITRKTDETYPNELPQKGHGGYLAIVGYIIIILSIVGYVVTSISWFRGLSYLDYVVDPTHQLQNPAYQPHNTERYNPNYNRANEAVPTPSTPAP